MTPRLHWKDGFWMLVLGAAVVAGFAAAVWALWVWVIPQLWPTGPAELTAPNYLVFIAALALVRVLYTALTIGAGK